MRSMIFFNFLLEATLIGSVMILLLILARALFRAKIGSRLCYAAWLVVALRLLIPLSLPNPLMNHLRPGLSTDMLARPVADQIRTRAIDAAMRASETLRAYVGSGELSHAIEALGRHTYEGETGVWLLLAYGLVALFLVIWMFAQGYRLRRRILRDRVGTLDGDARLLYHRLCVRLLVKPAPVYYVDRLAAPCTIGIFNPIIALPADALPAHVQAMLCHQLGHVKSWDGLWLLVRCLCCTVHWFNPLVWLAAWLSRHDAEMSCDELVTGKMDQGERIAYADVVAATHNASGHGFALPAIREAWRERQMKKRMTAVLSNVHVKGWAATLAAALCVCMLTASFLTGEKYASARITVLPQVRWQAGEELIQSRKEAVGYARRFLESPFINVDTSRFAFMAEMESTKTKSNELIHSWRVEGFVASNDVHLTLRFKQNGMLLEYDGLYQTKDVNVNVRQATAPALPQSMSAYLHGFTDACLPHQEWVNASFDGDALGGEQQLFDLRLNLIDKSGKENLHAAKVRLLLNDAVRVVSFQNQ